MNRNSNARNQSQRNSGQEGNRKEGYFNQFFALVDEKVFFRFSFLRINPQWIPVVWMVLFFLFALLFPIAQDSFKDLLNGDSKAEQRIEQLEKQVKKQDKIIKEKDAVITEKDDIIQKKDAIIEKERDKNDGLQEEVKSLMNPMKHQTETPDAKKP